MPSTPRILSVGVCLQVVCWSIAHVQQTKSCPRVRQTNQRTLSEQVSATGELLAVTWAPMFEGVLMCAAKDMADYHSAHSEFLRLVEEGLYAESHTLRKRLKPGQCLLFNNRRMLHGREVSRSGASISELNREGEARRGGVSRTPLGSVARHAK